MICMSLQGRASIEASSAFACCICFFVIMVPVLFVVIFGMTLLEVDILPGNATWEGPETLDDNVTSYANISGRNISCQAGIKLEEHIYGNTQVCCPASCGTCSGPGCNNRNSSGGLYPSCCAGSIHTSGIICETPQDTGCILP